MAVIETRSRSTSGLATVGGFALLYLALGFVARSTVVEGTTFSLVWPAGGVAVLWFLVRNAGLLSVDTGLLAACVLGVNWVTGAALDVSVVLVATNVLQTVLAVWLMRRWCPRLWGCGGDRPLEDPRVLIRFLAAAAIATAAGAALGTLGFGLVTGTLDQMGGMLWFGRNFGSVLTLTSLGLLLGQWLSLPRPRPRLMEAGPAQPLEMAAAVAFTSLMYVLVFRFDDLPLTFPLLAATAWVGLRFATLLSTAYATLIGAGTVALTLRGVGPFAVVDSPEVGALIAQLYVGTIVITALALSTGRDERQALAVELRRTEAKAVYEAEVRDAIIGSMTEGLLVMDESGEMLVVNPAAAVVLDMTDTEVSRESLMALVVRHLDGSLLADGDNPAALALRGETVRDMELVVGDIDETARILAVSASPLPRDVGSGSARVLLLYRDVTAEHARREELSAFAGVVAHDLRNPLAAIDGWTELIGDELAAGELAPDLANEFVSRVRSSSARMRELIGDLLDHATSTARDINLSPVDVGELVADIVQGRNVGPEVTCGPIPMVSADAVLIRQVLDNLIGNALKYVAAGVEPRVVITGFGSQPTGVTVRIADNGIGLPAGEHEQIFEEFHRAHHRDYEGSGLGLSICRRIVTRHGGTIVAYDNPRGQGTVFEFTLPAHDADLDGAGDSAGTAEPAVQQTA